MHDEQSIEQLLPGYGRPVRAEQTDHHVDVVIKTRAGAVYWCDLYGCPDHGAGLTEKRTILSCLF